MQKVPLIELVQFIKLGEAAKKEIDRRGFKVDWDKAEKEDRTK
jgi:hypothetical protein